MSRWDIETQRAGTGILARCLVYSLPDPTLNATLNATLPTTGGPIFPYADIPLAQHGQRRVIGQR